MQIFECITQTHNMKTNNKIGQNNKAKKTITQYIDDFNIYFISR